MQGGAFWIESVAKVTLKSVQIKSNIQALNNVSRKKHIYVDVTTIVVVENVGLSYSGSYRLHVSSILCYSLLF
jgi:hypothetical protein